MYIAHLKGALSKWIGRSHPVNILSTEPLCSLPAYSLRPQLFGTLLRLDFNIFATFLTVLVGLGTCWIGFESQNPTATTTCPSDSPRCSMVRGLSVPRYGFSVFNWSWSVASPGNGCLCTTISLLLRIVCRYTCDQSGFP